MEERLRIRVGSALTFEFQNPTPVIALLNVHSSRAADLEVPDHLIVSPALPVIGYHDVFGNWCSRFVAPAGAVTLSVEGIIRDAGTWDEANRSAAQEPIPSLTPDTLQFLLGSRYCETSLLSEFAWATFGGTPLGHERVQAVVDYVHDHLLFDYGQSRATRTAAEAHRERVGVCRDFAHLAIALLRCLNIPARYCTGYISDIGLPPTSPQDFAAWIEVFLGGSWHVYDPRNNDPRIGRILVARGRDAEDVPLTLTFGTNQLKSFAVTVEEVVD
jgi:transglutaminase-like putative cysteine protease